MVEAERLVFVMHVNLFSLLATRFAQMKAVLRVRRFFVVVDIRERMTRTWGQGAFWAPEHPSVVVLIGLGLACGQWTWLHRPPPLYSLH